ncbi:MAG: aspartyl protease family protein [Gracilimonas sp.]|uniref:aspartyl protease family protein n=1 Tax=Gracilimonas sp. TaxID=1974203 RepID=UPI0019ABD46F|nr:aspartyl protease family protein [Gracilimonas sp.]MBD3615202.1 aspartyl protease family protein [Gracilimonas sp.]
MIILKAFKKSCVLVLLLLLLAGSNILYAQESTPNIFEITQNKDRRVTIPFKLINNLIVVEVHINNSVPMKFILDSGATGNIITSLYDEELYLNNVNTVRLAGLGEGTAIEAFQSLDNTIQIGDRIRAVNAEILLLKQDVFQLDTFMGTRIHGILGHDFFESFIVEINYSRKLLRIYEPNNFKEKFKELPEHRKWYELPMSVQDNKSYLNVGYKHKNGDEFIPLRLLLDTGASNSFSLYESMDESIKVPDVTINSIIGTGLSGKVTGELGRVQSMKVGEFIFEEPVVAFPDSHSVRRVLRVEDRKGSIGGDIFRRFKVIFNYGNELLYLRRNSDFNDEFYFNTSGIEVYTPVPDLPFYVVAYVREGSPAFSAGVKEGDVIREINGTRAVDLKMNDLINYLQYKKSKTISLKVERDSTVKNLSFRMDAQLVPDS